MKIKNIYNYLNSISPFDTQEKWDNSGLIIGNMKDKFKNIYISLDLDLKTIKKVKKNSLIITHHPLIFSPLKKINGDSYSSKIVRYLIKNNIYLISMHTNIDKSHLNEYVGKKVLKFNFKKVDDFIITAKVNMKFNKLLKIIKKRLNINIVKNTKTKKFIKNISLTTGSGMSLLNYIKTDCFLTGDIKYHEAMEADSKNISLIDIGHYESEIHFIYLLNKLLKPYLKNKNKKAIMLKSNNPFNYN
ncbi:MAG: Nif3-like dinuclear metal center hexameric protein [Campylobacterota bacterium]|nr:Nif3-like dinuclear metal center hexameric protein [Campylobacterota bacterium]